MISKGVLQIKGFWIKFSRKLAHCLHSNEEQRLACFKIMKSCDLVINFWLAISPAREGCDSRYNLL